MSHYDDYCREREEPDEEREGDEPVNELPPGACYAMWGQIHEAAELLGDAIFDQIPDAKFLHARDALHKAEMQIRVMERALHAIAGWKRFQPTDRAPNEAEQGANAVIDNHASLACEALGYLFDDYRASECTDPDPTKTNQARG